MMHLEKYGGFKDGRVVRTSRDSITDNFLLFFFFYKFIYLFLSALDLCCCAWASFSCGERGLLFFAVHGLLTLVASLVVEHGL